MSARRIISSATFVSGRAHVARLSDAQLVARCRSCDEAAWAELVERFSGYVYSIAARAYGLSDADAHDVRQEAFTRTYANLDRLVDDAAIRPWLAQLTRRLCVDRLRAQSRVELGEFEAPAGETCVTRLDETLSLHDALSRLPEHCREILDRFFARDESYRTIAAALDLPAGTIASRISRSLEKLRADLEESGLEWLAVTD